MERVYKLIRLNRLLRSHRVKFAAALAAHHLRFRHLAVRVDPVMACNLRCTMCFFSNEEYVKNAKGIFTSAEIERLADMFFPRALLAVFGCGTEPTLYRDFPELVRLAQRHRVPHIGFTTNGQLLQEEHIRKFIKYGLHELTISTHGVTKETYERFMVNASFERLHDVLRLFDAVKRETNSTLPHLRLNYTVNATNLDDLNLFFDVYGKYKIKTLQVRPIIDFHGQFRDLLTANDLPKYDAAIAKLHAECKARGVVLLANTSDPTFETENSNSAILQAVHRRITPMEVWRPDFNWRTETYVEFCKRIGWSSHLLKLILSDLADVNRYSTGAWGKHSAKYEVESPT
ncbi:MAG: radical protein [Bacteroidetes bacterium]|nr:radical protein [Bacteroidota bacterium]